VLVLDLIHVNRPDVCRRDYERRHGQTKFHCVRPRARAALVRKCRSARAALVRKYRRSRGLNLVGSELTMPIFVRMPASSRFYIDDSNVIQGPFASSALRGWLLAGFLRSSTRVAPSFHGVVPVEDEFQPVSVLWSDPQRQVSDSASQAVHGPACPHYFVACFVGLRDCRWRLGCTKACRAVKFTCIAHLQQHREGRRCERRGRVLFFGSHGEI
jgi:hypothetical protein